MCNIILYKNVLHCVWPLATGVHSLSSLMIGSIPILKKTTLMVNNVRMQSIVKGFLVSLNLCLFFLFVYHFDVQYVYGRSLLRK